MFLNFVVARFFPPSLTLEAVLLGRSSKESWILKHFVGSNLHKTVDLEIVLLRYVVRINENIFSSSFVQDCSIFDELPLPVLHSFKTTLQSDRKLVFSSHAGFVYNCKWIDLLSSLLGQGQKSGVGVTVLSLSVGCKATTRCMSKSLAVICTSSILCWLGKVQEVMSI